MTGGQVSRAVGGAEGGVFGVQGGGQRRGELDVGQIRQGASRIERGRDQ